MRRLRKGVRIGAQEQEPSDRPDIKRPPDADLPEFDDDVPLFRYMLTALS